MWPVSRLDAPKQFQSFTDNLSLLSHTVKRADALATIDEVVLVCSAAHQHMVYQHSSAHTHKPTSFLLEPIARNTAAAITCAAVYLQDQYPDDELCMLVLPSDHLISDVALFEEAVDYALKGAHAGYLVTFGVVATKPETGYGYIEVGEALPPQNVCKVARFVEKPTAQRAQEMLSTGRYRWNSGMFLMPVPLFMQEIKRYDAPVAHACTMAVAQSSRHESFIQLSEKALSECPSISIDHAVFEHSEKVAVVSLDAPWTDLGSWAAVADIQENRHIQPDRSDAIIEINAKHNYVRAHKTVAIIGIDNVVVVDTPDALLISHRDSTQSVKDIVSCLNMQHSRLTTNHSRTQLPWGTCESVDAGVRHHVKNIVVHPGGFLHLQTHAHCVRHLLVVSGTATMTIESTTTNYPVGQHICIPKGSTYRVENQTESNLALVEVEISDLQHNLGSEDMHINSSSAALGVHNIPAT